VARLFVEVKAAYGAEHIGFHMNTVKLNTTQLDRIRICYQKANQLERSEAPRFVFLPTHISRFLVNCLCPLPQKRCLPDG
jgi:hypothetical protein